MSRLPIFKSMRIFSLLFATTLPALSAVPLPPAFSPSDRELIALAKTAAACTASDDLPALTKSWNQFKDRAAKDPTKYTHIPGHWMTPIALLGTDELWNDYAAWFQKEFPGRIPVAALLPIARPSLKDRLSPLLQAQIAKMEEPSHRGVLRNMYASCARVARLLDDDESLRMLMARNQQRTPVADKGLDSLAHLLRLREGKLQAATPVIWARPAPNNEWQILWSLAGLTDRYKRSRILDLGGGNLDHAFDLTILASPDKEMDNGTSVHQIPSATFRGSVALSLPENTRYLALEATNRITGKSRRCHAISPFPLQLHPLAAAINVPQESRPTLQDRVVPTHPFGLDEEIHAVELSPGEQVEIATLPWSHGYSSYLSVWACFEGDAKLSARILDPEGNLVREHAFASNPGDIYLPVWSRQLLQLYSQTTINPHTIVLTATVRHVGPKPRPNNPLRIDTKAPNIIWLTGLRQKIYEADRPPTDAKIVGAARSAVTAMASDETGEFLALGLNGGRLALMSTKDGTMKQSQAGGHKGFWYVGAAPDRVVGLDYMQGVHVMERSSLAIKKLGSLDLKLIERSRPKMKLSPDGQWLVWIGKKSDVYAIHLDADKLGEPIRIPVGKFPEMMIDRKADTLHLVGTVCKFAIPFRELQPNNPPQFTPTLEFGKTSSVAEYVTKYSSYWVDPVHGTYVGPSGFQHRLDPKTRVFSSPAGSRTTLTPSGMIYVVSSSGLVRRLDPTTAKSYLPPKQPGAPMFGHNCYFLGSADGECVGSHPVIPPRDKSKLGTSER